MSVLRLEGKSALVTGASSGIGRAIAIRFAREGANVAINYFGEEGEARVTEALVREAGLGGAKCMVVPADVADEGQVAV